MTTEARTTRPKTFQRRARPAALAACLLAALLLAGASPARTRVAQEEGLDTVRTPAGELSLVRRRDGENVRKAIAAADDLAGDLVARNHGRMYGSQ